MSLREVEGVEARMAVVGEHIRCENRHDLDAVMATFGIDARYDDEPWGDHRSGRDDVRSYYTELMRALPDLAIEVRHRHAASDNVVLEVHHPGYPPRAVAEPASDRPTDGVPDLRRLHVRRRRPAGR